MAHFASMLVLARILGYRIIWTVHEVVPHESPSPRRDVVAARMLARASHVVLAHDKATATRATGVLRRRIKTTDVIPHGSYVGAYPPGRPRAVVRKEWELPDSSFVFLAFGNLRSYKRLDLVLDAFARLPDPDVSLVIAGEFIARFPDPDWMQSTRARLQGAAERDARIRCRIGTVPVEAVAELHDACDAAVFGRSDGWTSGSMILALSEGLPVVAARRTAYVELLDDGASGWFYEPGDVNSLSDAMALAASERDQAREKGHQARVRATALGWQGIAAGTAAVMMATLPSRHS
jgi:glycosyltransferase involved in cell wall biosynthesis